MENHGEIILYQPNDEVKLEVRLAEETVWLTQAQMAELFQTSKQNVSLHTHNVFLEVLSFSGLLGFIPFVIYITSSAINIFKNIKKCLLDILSNDSKCALCFIATIFTAFIIWGITENGAIYSLAALSFFTQLAFGVSNTLAHKSSSI